MARVSTPPPSSPATTPSSSDSAAGATPSGAVPEAGSLVSHDATLKWVLSDHMDLGETPEPVVEYAAHPMAMPAELVERQATPPPLVIAKGRTTPPPFDLAFPATAPLAMPAASRPTVAESSLPDGVTPTAASPQPSSVLAQVAPEDAIVVTTTPAPDVLVGEDGETDNTSAPAPATAPAPGPPPASISDGFQDLGATPADFFAAGPTPPPKSTPQEVVYVREAITATTAPGSDSAEISDDSLELLPGPAEEPLPSGPPVAIETSIATTAAEAVEALPRKSSFVPTEATEPTDAQGLEAREVEPEAVIMVADSSEHVIETTAPSRQPLSTTPPPVPVEATQAMASRAGGAAEAASAVQAPPSEKLAAALFEEFQTPAASAATVPEALERRPLQKRSKPWYEEVFDDDYLRTVPFMTPEQTTKEVGFIRTALQASAGNDLLDVGCGYGRHAMEFAQQGFRVTGLDLSLPLLIKAADQAQKRGLNVNFVHADMREMTFSAQFDAAYCVLSSFGYFDEETNLRVATSICRALKPGGRFILDVINRDYIVGDLPSRVWWEGDGCVILEEVDFNYHTSRLLVRRSVVFGNGRQSEQEISMRAYSLHEVGRLLRQAGLRVLDISGSLAARSKFFGAASRNIIALCERPIP